MFRAILFDLDGTLLAPAIDFKALRNRLSIPPGESILDWVNALPEEERECRMNTLVEVEIEAAHRATLLQGTEQTLEWILGHGIQVGILTRNCQEAWEIASRRCSLDGIKWVFTRESGIPKPDPRCLEPIMNEWDLSARDIVHVGDYLYDLLLAEATGMYSILVHPTGINPFQVDCHFVARDHEALLGHLKCLEWA